MVALIVDAAGGAASLRICAAMLTSLYGALVCGHSHYLDMLPNGHRVMGGKWHALGHVAPSPRQFPDYVLAGFPRNQFGLDFAAAGHRWTLELCRRDSDGDGWTNGQELGDPNCIWHLGLEADPFCNVTHPGLSPRQERVQLAVVALRSLKGWKRDGLSKNAFTAALYYYQFVAIPMLVLLALLLSACVRGMPRVSWLGIFCSYYVLFICGVGCGVHRYFSHKSFVASKPHIERAIPFYSQACKTLRLSVSGTDGVAPLRAP